MYSICTRSICPSKSNGARSKYASETDEPRSQPTSNDSVAVNVSGTVNGVVASSACLPSMLKISLAGAPGLADDGNVSTSMRCVPAANRSEEHTSELQSLMRISYAVFCLKKKKKEQTQTHKQQTVNNIHNQTTENIHTY